MLGHLRGELADDSPASRGTPRMHNATSGVSTFEAQGQAARAIGVEADADRVSSSTANGASSQRTRLLIPLTAAAAGRDGIGEMQAGAVIFREGGGEPALGPVARGLGQRRGGDQQPRGRLRGPRSARV